jgi:DNA-binding CsgD family transcriptional regulator
VWARRLAGDEPACVALTLRGRGERLKLEAFAQTNRLTPAEARVIAMIVDGEDSSAIAAALHISLETLRTHVKHAYRKVGVSSRGELFARALDFVQP